jgi:hypothetical protein
MAKHERQFLKGIHFTGGRFEETEGWLDLDILNELLIYKTILLTAAGEIWLRQHQDRLGVPERFASDFRLGLTEIDSSSCSLRLECIVSEMSFEQAEILRESVQAVDSTLIAAQNAEPLPEEMPASVLKMFEKWGTTLRPDESIILTASDGYVPVFNRGIRDKLAVRTSKMTTTPLVKEDEYANLTSAESILKMVAEIHQANPEPEGYVPPPSDLAKNYKHYLYGFPKEE